MILIDQERIMQEVLKGLPENDGPEVFEKCKEYKYELYRQVAAAVDKALFIKGVDYEIQKETQNKRTRKVKK